jgi:hypothetical protein
MEHGCAAPTANRAEYTQQLAEAKQAGSGHAHQASERQRGQEVDGCPPPIVGTPPSELPCTHPENEIQTEQRREREIRNECQGLFARRQDQTKRDQECGYNRGGYDQGVPGAKG